MAEPFPEPVAAAQYRLCVQCGDGFLSVESRALCEQECRDAWEVKRGLGHEPKLERMHVDHYLEIGNAVRAPKGAYICMSITTRGPGATVGEFLRLADIPDESPLREDLGPS